MLVKQGCLGKVRGERVVCSQDRCKEDAERAPGRSSEGCPTPHVLAVTVVVRALIRTLVYACTGTSDKKTVWVREKPNETQTAIAVKTPKELPRLTLMESRVSLSVALTLTRTVMLSVAVPPSRVSPDST